MSNSQKLRYWVGKTANQLVDSAVAWKLMPARFPAGHHLEFDLQRFLDRPVRQIIDGGANVGDTSLRFAQFFREATVHAFEPVGRTFGRLQQRTAGQPRIVPQNLALGDQETQFRIKLSADSELNSLLVQETASPTADSELIQVVRLDKYAETRSLEQIDLLKLDVEGFELQALSGACSLLEKKKIRAVYAECGFVRTDTCKTYIGRLDERLTGHGFMFAGFYQTFRWGPGKRWAGFSNGLWLLP